MKRIGTKNTKVNFIFIILLILLLPVIAISVGFASLSSAVSINGTALVNPVSYIVIMSNVPDQSTNVNSLSYSHTIDTISIGANLEHLNDKVIYNVNVRNLGQTNKQLTEIISEIFSNEDMKYTLTGLSIDDIIMAGDSVDFKVTFEYKNNVSTIDETQLNAMLRFVFDDYILPVDRTAYFQRYNGISDFMGFESFEIKGFVRNTTLTRTEVLEQPGVQLISTSSSDTYASTVPVYGWIDSDGVFNWWSTATTVKFHPLTLNGFRNQGEILSVNLNGTDTSLVENFANWFDKDRKLVSILGTLDTSGLKLQYNPNFNYANDSDENSTSGFGLTYLFNDCNELINVDISHIDTTNASDVKRMFGGCRKLKNIDVSHFNLGNAKSMYWMFRACGEMTSLDLSNWNVSNVENMYGMFNQCSKLEEIKLGIGFDTTKVKKFGRMFYENLNLKTIYALRDFKVSSDATSSDMFFRDTKLVGARGESYAFSYSSSYTSANYAKIADPNQNGYFTLAGDVELYDITYNLDGGIGSNPTAYTENSPTINLVAPVKTGYVFTGWTGSNGNTPQTTVSIPSGSTGDKEYTAHWTPGTYTVIFNANGGTGTMANQTFTYDTADNLNPVTYTKQGFTFVNWSTTADGLGSVFDDEDEILNLVDSGSITLYAQWRDVTDYFPVVFHLAGPCVFHGSGATITGNNCLAYANAKYINTNIHLYNEENRNKDFEITFTLDNYVVGSQTETQATILNSKYENSSLNYPGFVLRRNNTNLELTAKFRNTSKAVTIAPQNGDTYRIVRKDGIIYYSVNGGELSNFITDTSYNGTFTTPVTFGASLNSSGNPMRYLIGSISNISIKVGTLESLS